MAARPAPALSFMPSYEYELIDRGEPTGLRVTLLRPVDARDEPITLRRVEVPRSLAIAGNAVNPMDPVQAMRRGYKMLEERGQLPAHMRVPELVGQAAQLGAGLRERDGGEDPNNPSAAG